MNIKYFPTQYIYSHSDEWKVTMFSTWIKKTVVVMDQAFVCSPQFSLSIYISETFDCPACWSDRSDTRINLALEDLTHWSKVVYQFAHEYCHAVISSPHIPTLLRDEWFEEVICECASRYSLYQLNKDPLAKKIYQDSFKGYSDELFLKKNAREIEPKELIAENSPLQQEVRSNHEDRLVFNFLANQIYPIIEDDPTIWQSIPLLAKFSDSNTFQQNLEVWKANSHKANKASIQRIIDLFS